MRQDFKGANTIEFKIQNFIFITLKLHIKNIKQLQENSSPPLFLLQTPKGANTIEFKFKYSFTTLKLHIKNKHQNCIHTILYKDNAVFSLNMFRKIMASSGG